MASDLERLDRQRREALARAEDAEARLSAVLALCDQTGGGPDAWLYVVDVLAAVRGECDRPAAFSISDADDGHPVISYSGEGDRPAEDRGALAWEDGVLRYADGTEPSGEGDQSDRSCDMCPAWKACEHEMKGEGDRG